jgi:hypothetical protein
MLENIAEDKEKVIKEKLEYIGLNLERVPKFLKEFTPFSFRPSKAYDDMSYKVYQYVDVTQIQILLTPTDRLTNLSEKYKLAIPISQFLDSKTEKNLEYFTAFLKLLNDMHLEDLKVIEKEQEQLQNQIPYEIKYEHNYIWQIYYSDVANQYFMLAPINETNNVALFYLLKKQIEAKKNRKKELIYVPITHLEYSGNYLVKSQITDLENYIWYFTKQWPNIYEVYDKKEKMSLVIVGKTKIYEKIESDYVVTYTNKEEAQEFYKLLKALFILATGLSEEYQFQIKIDEKGGIDFYYITEKEEKVIYYSTLTEFIQNQVNQKKIAITLEERKLKGAQEKLQELKQIVEKQNEEYLIKQRQIATFLECKKTFFGKIKYYFSNRKKELKPVNSSKNKKETLKEEYKKQETILEENKKLYTIEDLIEVCTKLDGRKKMVKNLKLDQKALELKKVNLERKIKNANIYLNEIDLHKKSIFEFWKFTNKDELPSLNEGEKEENKEKEKIGKSFDYETDIEELGKQVDELQRRKFSKNETDGIFAIKQVLTTSQILNNTESKDLNQEQKQILEQELENLKKEYENNIDVIRAKDFDIFGSMSEDKTKIKVLNNQKHREVEKDKYNILNITLQTELDTFIDTLRNYLKLVKEAFCKINTTYELSVYLAKEKAISLENLQILHLDQKKAIEQNLGQKEIYLYRLNVSEKVPILYYSNIIFFENFNQTLPKGMDVSDEILIDLNNCILKEKKKEIFQYNHIIDNYHHEIIQVHVMEYEVKKKET